MHHILHTDEASLGKATSTADLGKIIKLERKRQGITIEKLASLTNIGTRFISELERGKQTAEIGKTLLIINALGIIVTMEKRSSSNL